jgi:hypothetical protein
MINFSRCASLITVMLFAQFTFADTAGLNISKPWSISKKYTAGDSYMGVILRGAVKLRRDQFNGLAPRELSGLAWDSDEARLYALSDDGHIVHLRPIFEAQMLIGVEILETSRLRDRNGDTLEDEFSDAEGLVALNSRNGTAGDTQLAISFGQHPRIELHSPDGVFLHPVMLPEALRRRANSDGENYELEALTDHPDFGLITGPQHPLQSALGATFSLHSLNGKVWRYTPLDYKYSALVGLESMRNGDLLLLERRYSSIFKPVIFALRRLHLPQNNELDAVVSEEVVHFDIKEGWSVDNFEGVARYEGNGYFLISDDNKSRIQKTLLLYIEINSATAASAAHEGNPGLN